MDLDAKYDDMDGIMSVNSVHADMCPDLVGYRDTFSEMNHEYGTSHLDWNLSDCVVGYGVAGTGESEVWFDGYAVETVGLTATIASWTNDLPGDIRSVSQNHSLY